MAGYPEALKAATWAVELEPRDLSALGRLGQHDSWYVCQLDDALWLAGPPLHRELADELARLPCRLRYRLDQQNRLIPQGGRVPIGRLPTRGWVPLPESFTPRLPNAAMPADLRERQEIRLLPAEDEQPAGALLTDLPAWQQYGDTAPEIRLQRLTFAVAADSRVLVIGTPLPPLPGQSLMLDHQLLVPAGYRFAFPAVRPVLPRLLGLGPDDLALFFPDGSWERIASDNRVAAGRDAIRASGEEPTYA